MKNKIILSILLGLITLLILIGVSYSFYTANVKELNQTETVIKTKKLSLIYTGGQEISVGNIIPGDSFTKTFTVENTSDTVTTYNIYLENVTNEFNEDLVYVLKDETGVVVDETPLPITKAGKTYILTDISIDKDKIKTYTLTVEYKYLEDVNQNAYQGSIFKATLGVDSEKVSTNFDISTMKSIWLGDSIIAGYGNDNKGFSEYYKDLTNSESVINRGFGGSTISDNTPQVNDDPITLISSINYLVDNKSLYQDLDLIVLDGGGNDVILYDLDSTKAAYKKEIGTVGVEGDTVINDFEEILDTLENNFPNAKILYIQPFSYSQEAIENIVYKRIVNDSTLDELNSWLGTTASSKEELRENIVSIYTNGTAGYPTSIPNIKNRADALFPQIKTVVNNHNLEYLDLTTYIEMSTHLQNDGIHLTDAGYTHLTPYIVDKISSMFE